MQPTDKIYYVYENHLDGGYYITDHELSYEDTHCSVCGDSDYLYCSGTKQAIIEQFQWEIEDAKETVKMKQAELEEIEKKLAKL